MHTGRLIFSQLMDHLPMLALRCCVEHYQGDRWVKSFRCIEHDRCMAFAQLTYRESLADIEACLRAQGSKLYHMGIPGAVSRSTLADANEGVAGAKMHRLSGGRFCLVVEPFYIAAGKLGCRKAGPRIETSHTSGRDAPADFEDPFHPLERPEGGHAREPTSNGEQPFDDPLYEPRGTPKSAVPTHTVC